MQDIYRTKLKGAMSLHMTCVDIFGVARPGKTERDKLNGHNPHKKNTKPTGERGHRKGR